jgi:hypothetical protein
MHQIERGRLGAAGSRRVAVSELRKYGALSPRRIGINCGQMLGVTQPVVVLTD